MKIKIIVPENEKIKALNLANNIEHSHKIAGNHTPRLNNRLGCLYTENERGIIGEFAFSMLSGLPVDNEIKLKDHGIDFKLPNGKTIDVKTSHRKSAYSAFNLLIKNTDVEQNSVADYLIHGEIIGENTIIFHGYTEGKDIKNWEKRPSKLEQVKFNYVKQASDMLPLTNLIKIPSNNKNINIIN